MSHEDTFLVVLAIIGALSVTGGFIWLGITICEAISSASQAEKDFYILSAGLRQTNTELDKLRAQILDLQAVERRRLALEKTEKVDAK